MTQLWETPISDRTISKALYCDYYEHPLSTAFTVDGACNCIVVETWLETCLLPTLPPRKVVILEVTLVNLVNY